MPLLSVWQLEYVFSIYHYWAPASTSRAKLLPQPAAPHPDIGTRMWLRLSWAPHLLGVPHLYEDTSVRTAAAHPAPQSYPAAVGRRRRADDASPGETLVPLMVAAHGRQQAGNWLCAPGPRVTPTSTAWVPGLQSAALPVGLFSQLRSHRRPLPIESDGSRSR
ncbi:hypothetical protein NDU88_007614 [Pleurodeles waltl]|uniref:Uncharacterized protein n=1 Tax=Pleurodeles waltl TaxID=8319 RepID=A0AAV7U2U0_PLEWA|nr:hypothetical protein NDU88_007614 [Pleurodeles waltl]